MEKRTIAKIQITLGTIVLIVGIAMILLSFYLLQQNNVLKDSGKLWDSNAQNIKTMSNETITIATLIYSLDALSKIENVKQTWLILSLLITLLFTLSIMFVNTSRT